MLSEPRTIALIMELIHLPMQHSASRLRNLYSQLCTECEFENFTRRPGGAVIERPPSEEAGLSRVTFSADRLRFSEERGLLTLDGYCRTLGVILQKSMEELKIPVFLMQQCTVRTLVTPVSFKNASDFIGSKLMNIPQEDLSAIGRPANVFGFRLAVPPISEERNGFQVRVEVFARDPKSIYIENIGAFRTPVNKNDLTAAGKAMEATSTFVSENVYEFLSRFDAPADSD